MRSFYGLFLCCILWYSALYAQQKPSHISGSMEISMKQGLIRCNFTLSQLPPLGNQYRILLNRGLNIRLLKSTNGQVLDYDGYYNSTLKGEAVGYWLLKNSDTLPLPPALEISYTGAFPVYKDTLNAFDFKGLIAFNGKTLRAADQSKWYPVIYDVRNDKELPDVTYDIRVDCKDCQSIYINGAPAQQGPVVNLHAARPHSLVLFAGDYTIQQVGTTTFLNVEISAPEAKVFTSNIAAIIRQYETYLQQPYGEAINFIEHQAVEVFKPGKSWGFVTYPSILVAGERFKNQVNVATGRFTDTATFRFYAHELAHYYFGQLLQPNATLKWFFLESMAEFLSVKAAGALYGEGAVKNFIDFNRNIVKDWKIIPLPDIRNPDNIGEGYRYNYGPLLLLAMEKRFGKEAVGRFCRACLRQAGQLTDYAFLLKMVDAAGIPFADWKLFEEQVINQRACSNVFRFL